MKLEVGKEYTLTRGIMEFSVRVLKDLDDDNDYRVQVIKTNTFQYRLGSRDYISDTMIGGYFKVTPYVPVDELAVAETIVMNNTLYDMYVNMAIDTDDKEWLIELGNWKKSQKGVNV